MHPHYQWHWEGGWRMTEGDEVKGTGNGMSEKRVEEARRGREEERTRRRGEGGGG